MSRTLKITFQPTPGYYQDLSGEPTCKLCPAGSYCDPYEITGNTTGVITPTSCPRGYYCPSTTRYALQNPCAPGSFGNESSYASQS